MSYLLAIYGLCSLHNPTPLARSRAAPLSSNIIRCRLCRCIVQCSPEKPQAQFNDLPDHDKTMRSFFLLQVSVIQQSVTIKMMYTSELIPERNHKEKCMSSGVDDPWWMRSPDNPLLIQLVSTNTKTRPLSLLSQWVGVITTGAVVKE